MPKILEKDREALDEVIARYEPVWEKLDNENRALAQKITMLTAYAGGRKAAAEAMGVGGTTVDNYRSGKTQPKFLELLHLAKAAEHTIPYLVAGTEFWTMLRTEEEIKEEDKEIEDNWLSNAVFHGSMVPVPRYEVQASAGGGSVVLAEDVRDCIVVESIWLERYIVRGKRTGFIEARGDSMEPTIRDGDILLLNFDISDQEVANGGVFVITVDGNLFVKRLRIMVDGSIQVLSDNKKYLPESIAREIADEKMQVHARVVWSGGPLR